MNNSHYYIDAYYYNADLFKLLNNPVIQEAPLN